jgi:RNA polymerase sigma factor (sigma-70 family)
MTPAAVLSLARARGGEVALRLLPDEQLARLAANGDARAFALIYERHHQELFRYCRSITRNAEDAADALQSTMAAALRSLPGEKREIALRPWLFRVAHNESIALIRRRRPHDELSDDAASPVDPHGQVALRERVGRLMGDLGRLPERQRGALMMRELSGLTYAEIGVALEMTAGAARQAVYEARLALTELESGRDMHCDEARIALSSGDRRVLRGRRISAHMRGCSDCQGFGDQVAVRRSALRVLVPPLPAAAGSAILAGVIGVGAGTGGAVAVGAAAAGGGGAGIAAAAGGALSPLAGASAAAKGAAAVALAVAAGVGTVEVANHAPLHRDPAGATAQQAQSRPAARSSAASPAADPAASAPRARERTVAVVAPADAPRTRPGERLKAPTGQVPLGRARARAPRFVPTTQHKIKAPAPANPAPQPAPTAPVAPAQPAAKPNPLKDFIQQQTQAALAMGLQQAQQGMGLSQYLLNQIFHNGR